MINRDETWINWIKQLKEFAEAFSRGEVQHMPEEMQEWCKNVGRAHKSRELTEEQEMDIFSIPGVGRVYIIDNPRYSAEDE